MLIATKGKVIESLKTDDPDEAMSKFVDLANSKFGPEHGVGAHVALVDQQLQFDAAKTYEGSNCYRYQFYKEEGRLRYEQANVLPALAA